MSSKESLGNFSTEKEISNRENFQSKSVENLTREDIDHELERIISAACDEPARAEEGSREDVIYNRTIDERIANLREERHDFVKKIASIPDEGLRKYSFDALWIHNEGSKKLLTTVKNMIHRDFAEYGIEYYNQLKLSDINENKQVVLSLARYDPESFLLFFNQQEIAYLDLQNEVTDAILSSNFLDAVFADTFFSQIVHILTNEFAISDEDAQITIVKKMFKNNTHSDIFYLIKKNIGIFSEKIHAQIAIEIIKNHNADSVYSRFGYSTSLNLDREYFAEFHISYVDIIARLIQEDEGIETPLDILKEGNMSIADVEKIYITLLKAKKGFQVIDFFDGLFDSIVDLDSAIDDVIESGDGFWVACNMYNEIFDKVDQKKIATKIIQLGQGWGVVSNMSDFEDLTEEDVCQILLREGEGALIAYNIEKFPHLSSELLAQIIRDHGDTKTSALFQSGVECFGEEEMIYYIQKNGETSLWDILSAFDQIPDLQKASNLTPSVFYKNILAEVCNDDRWYDFGSACQYFNAIVRQINALPTNSTLEEVGEQKEDIMVKKTKLFSSWDALKKYSDLVDHADGKSSLMEQERKKYEAREFKNRIRFDHSALQTMDTLSDDDDKGDTVERIWIEQQKKFYSKVRNLAKKGDKAAQRFEGRILLSYGDIAVGNMNKSFLMDSPRNFIKSPNQQELYVHFTSKRNAADIRKFGFFPESAPNGFGVYAYDVMHSMDDSTIFYERRKYEEKENDDSVAVFFKTPMDGNKQRSGEVVWKHPLELSGIKILSFHRGWNLILHRWSKNEKKYYADI